MVELALKSKGGKVLRLSSQLRPRIRPLGLYKSLTELPIFVYRMDDAMSLRDVLGVNFEEDDGEVFDPFASDGLSLPGAGGPGLLGAFDRKGGRLRE